MQPLRPGDPIDVVAPSSAFDRERFERGIKALADMGLVPRYCDEIFARTGHLAGSDERRKAELDAALQSDARAIILARGGYGLLRFATHVHRVPQKLLVGYSDATLLHDLWRRAGVPSIHGPMCTQLGEDPSAQQRLRQLLFGEPPPPLTWQPRTARAGRAEAPLAGGNLASLASMCGTPLQPSFRGCIVLLEDLNEPPYRLDRLLTQLLLSGALDGARAFVVGDLSAPGEDPANREETVAERLLTLGVPVVFGAPFGHAGRNQPVAFGCGHALDAETGELFQLEPPTGRG
ncbi:MAG TPA: LD-carboxypeptidase [Myxococcales bacterium]|nr:LD-carboxypeptidase [Myxococcales bacterium]